MAETKKLNNIILSNNEFRNNLEILSDNIIDLNKSIMELINKKKNIWIDFKNIDINNKTIEELIPFYICLEKMYNFLYFKFPDLKYSYYAFILNNLNNFRIQFKKLIYSIYYLDVRNEQIPQNLKYLCDILNLFRIRIDILLGRNTKNYVLNNTYISLSNKTKVNLNNLDKLLSKYKKNYYKIINKKLIRKYEIIRVPIIIFIKPALQKSKIKLIPNKVYELYPGYIFENQYIIKVNKNISDEELKNIYNKLSIRKNKHFINPLKNNASIQYNSNNETKYYWALSKNIIISIGNPKFEKASFPIKKKTYNNNEDSLTRLRKEFENFILNKYKRTYNSINVYKLKLKKTNLKLVSLQENFNKFSVYFNKLHNLYTDMKLSQNGNKINFDISFLAIKENYQYALKINKKLTNKINKYEFKKKLFISIIYKYKKILSKKQEEERIKVFNRMRKKQYKL